MWVHRGAAGIEVRAPAKLNLFFEVLGRRDDGYHEIETLMVPVSLCDALVFRDIAPGRSGPGEIRLCCRWAARPPREPLEEGPENIVYRSVELLRQRAGVERGASILLLKRIPAAGGLGGGSSDAAAALVAANLAWRLGYRAAELARLAAELGSDVPFFLAGGPALCRGRGERVEPVAGLGDLHAVIAEPPVGLSTAAVYARCRAEPRRCWPQPLCEALRGGRTGEAGRLLVNRLQEAAATLSPWVARLQQEFARLDCAGHQLTGSGSCYFGLCRHGRHARRVASRLAARNVGNVYAVRSTV